MADYIQTYSAKSDDELLNLAAQQDSLLPEAQSALNSVLRERRLNHGDVEEQKRWHDEIEIEEKRNQHRPFSLHGFGTTTYGKRDFEPDGSFITTKWIVLAWIPVIPLKSLRVIPTNDRRRFFIRSRDDYQTMAEFRPNFKQVAFTYMYELVIVFAALRLIRTLGSFTIFYIVIALWACVPWLLRRVSRL